MAERRIDGTIHFDTGEKHKRIIEAHGLDPSMWIVVKEESDRIFCIRKQPDEGAVANMMVLPKGGDT